MENRNSPLEKARTELLQSNARLERALSVTPDEHLNRSPSPTARSIVQIVAHCAYAIGGMKDLLQGIPDDVKSAAEADAKFWDKEQSCTTREHALELLKSHTEEYIAYVDSLTPNDLAEMIALPFGYGSVPRSVVLTFAPTHTMGHVSQINYIQTIYGDRTWN
jgi:uncharacterized damage-inducible protein DinB